MTDEPRNTRLHIPMKKVLLFVQDNELLTKQASMIISFTRTDGILLFHDKKNSQGHALFCEANVCMLRNTYSSMDSISHSPSLFSIYMVYDRYGTVYLYYN